MSAPREARRRLVSALFCDVVGSTTLAETLDAEILRRVLDRYFDVMRSAIERLGGTVEKFIGDAVVGAFGVPVAHEDDTLRAVRSALEMQAAAAELDAGISDAGVPLQVRIAISCGEVLADEAAAVQGRIAGDVFNTAARIQATASPGDVVVSGAAARMLRETVDLEPLGHIELRGKAEPIDSYRVLGIRPTPSRTETLLVGRDRVLSTIVDALQDALEARACVLFTILGPPGVGKSRLASEFADAVRERATVLVGQTPSYGDGVTFAPLAELLSQASGQPLADAEAVASALRHRLASEPDGVSIGDRLAQILGVGEAVASDTSWAVRRLLEVLAVEKPLVIVLEDLHWAETPMLDLVDSVVDQLHGATLLLCLARPELLEQRPTWSAGKPRTVTTTLPPLPEPDARRLAAILLGPQTPTSVLDRVCEAAEGNPLYMEQLTAMLEDQGLLVDGRWVGGDEADVDVPPTLQALLSARFDRLDPVARSLLERASVEGRRFRKEAILALWRNMPLDDFGDAIASLERRGLLQRDDESGERWRFAHALVREAVYRGLSKALRADLHERLADWMLREDADQPDVDESAARHLERSVHLREELGVRDLHSTALAERAGELFASAGSRAFASLNLLVACDLLGRAASLLPAASERRLDILPSLGVVLTETGSPEESDAVLTDAVEQARAMGSERGGLRATIQLLSNRVYRSPTGSEIDAAVGEAESAAEALQAANDDVGLAEAAVALEYLEFMRGRIARSHVWATRGLRHAIAAGRPRETAQSAADAIHTAVIGPLPFEEFASTADSMLLSPDEPISAATGQAFMVLSALAAGDDDALGEREALWRAIIDGHGLPWLGATHAHLFASVETWVGRPDAAERRLREAREVLATMGDLWWVGTLDSSLCRTVAAQGHEREFLRLADALEAAALVPDRQMQVRRNVVRARALLLRGSAADAEALARRGLELVEPTDLVLDHADALLTLADVLRERGFGDEAHDAVGQGRAMLRAKGCHRPSSVDD